MNIQNICIQNINSPKTLANNGVKAASTSSCPISSDKNEKSKLTLSNLQAYSKISFKAAMKDHLGQGARYLGNDQTKFTLTAPLADLVVLTAFSTDEDGNTQMKKAFLNKGDDGKFETVVDGVKPGDKYFYTLMKNNAQSKNIYDPRADYLPFDIDDYGDLANLSEVVDHSSFKWSDKNWMDHRKYVDAASKGWGLPPNTVIESMHVGTLGGFQNAKKELDKIADIGIASAVRVMPVSEFYGKQDWGYNDVAKYAVENAYGRPEDFKDFVNYAHKKGISVILDVVPNHFGPYGSVVQEVMPTFSDTKPETPWGKSPEFDGEDGKALRSYMTDMFMNWAVNYHVDGFRFDATQCMGSNDALRDMISELRSHDETKDLILYPEDMRMLSTMANSNQPKEISKQNWGFNALTTFDFYKALISNATKKGIHGTVPSVRHLERTFNNITNWKSDEDLIVKNKDGSISFIDAPPQAANNFIINISNPDEVGNDAGGMRNMVNIGAAMLDVYDRFGSNWQSAQRMTFDMFSNYVQTGEGLSEDVQKKQYGCNKPISKDEFAKVFNNSFALNKLMIGAMFMHPSPKEFFMGDERGELAPFKYFCEAPASATDHMDNMTKEKGYRPDNSAFEESKMGQKAFNSDFVNNGTLKFSKDFVKLTRTSPAFNDPDVEHMCTCSNEDDEILEVKRFNGFNEQAIAVINMSDKPKQHFALKTTDAKELTEVINSNDPKYNGDGKYLNRIHSSIKSNDLTIPPYSIVVFEPKKG